MSELLSGDVQRLPVNEGTARGIGDLPVSRIVDVAASTGSKDEQHASGSYGRTADVYGGLVRVFRGR